MKVAVIGFRNLTVDDLAKYLPQETTEIVSGGARGIDTCVKNYARQAGLKLTEILPDYAHYGRMAPLKRNEEIVGYCDMVIAFWDGQSHGTRYVIDLCNRTNR